MVGIDSQIIFLLVIALVVAMLIVILYLGREVRHKNEQITKLLSSSSVPLDAKTEMFNFYDEKGELKLSVRPEMVYYIESADNYAVIHYLNGNKLDKIFLRNTLKNIEWRFRDRNVVRCHRSYIINLNKVQMLRRDENEMLLDFGDDRVPPIPVSKGYVENVVNLFTQDTTNLKNKSYYEKGNVICRCYGSSYFAERSISNAYQHEVNRVQIGFTAR